jgi:hypothetical protein
VDRLCRRLDPAPRVVCAPLAACPMLLLPSVDNHMVYVGSFGKSFNSRPSHTTRHFWAPNVRPTSLCKVGNFVGYTLPITAACAVLFRVQLLRLLRLAECGQYGGGFREQKQAVGYADSASRVGFAAIRYFLEEVFEFMLYLPSTSASGEVVYKGGTNKPTAHHGLSLLQSLQRAKREVMGACNFESIPACLTECVTYFWAVWPVCSIGWIEISANKQRC